MTDKEKLEKYLLEWIYRESVILAESKKEFPVGSVIKVKIPQKYEVS